MPNTASNVSVGKPKTDGAVFWGAAGTTLPTDAKTALASAFISLGYASEDGVTISESRDSKTVKAWGGDTVLKPQTGYDVSAKIKLLETLNSSVAKVVYGAANVTVSESGFTIKHTSQQAESGVLVIDMALTGGKVKRLVCPNAQMVDQGDTSYTDGDAIGYDCTFECLPDASGVAIYDYTD